MNRMETGGLTSSIENEQTAQVRNEVVPAPPVAFSRLVRMGAGMNLQPDAGVLYVGDIPELTAVNHAEVQAAIAQQLGPGITAVHIDLGMTRFIDSSGLGALVTLQRTLTARGGKLRLANPQSAVLRLLELTQMQRVIEIVKT